MEAPAATAAKKSKSNKIDGQEPPKSGNRDGDESLDLIRRLPDEVLGNIIPLLTTKDGARTQAISRRWRPLCCSAPLNLQVDHSLTGQEGKRIVFVSKILADHPGPALRFAVPGIRLRDRYAKIDGWLCSRALTGLREIEFSYEIEYPRLRRPLPPSVFRFAPSLCVADIGYCDFPNEVAPSLKFPCLKQLSLTSVTLSEDALHSLLSACPVLKSLLLDWIDGIRCLRISSPTLRSMSCGARAPFDGQTAVNFQELIIEDAPSLEILLPCDPDYGPAAICIMRGPKLEILGLMSAGICKLELGTTVFRK